MGLARVTLQHREVPSRRITVELDGQRRPGGIRIVQNVCKSDVSVLDASDDMRARYTTAAWTGVCASGILFMAGQENLKDYEVTIKSIAGSLIQGESEAVAVAASLATKEALGLEATPPEFKDWELG